MLRFGFLLLSFTSLVLGTVGSFQRERNCDASKIEACRVANEIKYYNCEIFYDDSDEDTDTDTDHDHDHDHHDDEDDRQYDSDAEEYYVERKVSQCVCGLGDDYYTIWTECAKYCDHDGRIDLHSEAMKSSVCAEASKVVPNSYLASYISSRDQTQSLAWTKTKDLDHRTDDLSSRISAIMKSISGSSNTGESIEPALSTTEGVSSDTAAKTEFETTSSEVASSTIVDTAESDIANSKGTSSDSAAETESDTANSKGTSSDSAAKTESNATNSEGSSSNIAITAGCGSLISLILLSLL
ncbi:hypothetical protein CANMA_001760 [Candida margitis]|uniref:uncharacterized protein n=1 Tax=Candida margitis TaxID=1775924 RepID=UPI002227DF25|nr:uncharacterized protein CANMA_001760 [Candida margitis]KAI5969207.1 hypothetical protein CANMA_001760 [Candida margitis]